MRKRSLYIVIGLLVVLVILTNLRLPLSGRVKNVLSEGFIPFLEFWSRMESRSVFLINRVKQYSDLQIENTTLRKQIGELSVKVAQNSELERENRELRSMLDFKNRSDLRLLPARVIGRDPSNWWNTVLIDRGENDGVIRDMAVLTVDGLVGKTLEVMDNNAKVLLIVDENCKVSGWLRESGHYGIVQGNVLSGGMGAQCRMTYIDRYSTIKPNDEVRTSGLGGVFPKGIMIGKVTKVSPYQDPSNGTLYQEVNILPAVDLARIDEVFIGMSVKPPQEMEKEKVKGNVSP